VSGAGNTASYAFDAQGRRKTRTVNGATTVFVTDADNREVLEYNGTGAVQNWYSFALGPDDVLNQMNVAAGIYSAETHIWNHKRGRDVLLGPSLVFQVMDGIRFWGNVQMNPRMALQAPQSADAARSPA